MPAVALGGWSDLGIVAPKPFDELAVFVDAVTNAGWQLGRVPFERRTHNRGPLIDESFSCQRCIVGNAVRISAHTCRVGKWPQLR